MATIKAMKELARASKQINNNPNVRIQVAERHDGKGFNNRLKAYAEKIGMSKQEFIIETLKKEMGEK